MSDLVTGIVTRDEGNPLTPAEMDANLRILAAAANAMDARLKVSLNSNGTLKDSALNSATQIADSIISMAKLAFTLKDIVTPVPTAGSVLGADKVYGLNSVSGDEQMVTLDQVKAFSANPSTCYSVAGIPLVLGADYRSHSLGQVPDVIRTSIVCATTEYGYAVNDEIEVSTLEGSGAFINYPTVTIWTNTYLIAWIIPDPNWSIINRLTGNIAQITPANWTMKIRCYKLNL